MDKADIGRAAAALVLATLSLAMPARAGDPTEPYRLYVDACSRGQIDEALALFAEDAIVTAGPLCTRSAPCIGKAAIRERYLAVMFAQGIGPPLADQRFDGRRLSTHGEVSYLVGADRSVTRLLGGHVFELRDGSIASLRFELDPEDAETARYLASLAPIMATLGSR